MRTRTGSMAVGDGMATLYYTAERSDGTLFQRIARRPASGGTWTFEEVEALGTGTGGGANALAVVGGLPAVAFEGDGGALRYAERDAP